MDLKGIPVLVTKISKLGRSFGRRPKPLWQACVMTQVTTFGPWQPEAATGSQLGRTRSVDLVQPVRMYSVCSACSVIEQIEYAVLVSREVLDDVLPPWSPWGGALYLQDVEQVSMRQSLNICALTVHT